jgi:hypothetical protein
VKTWFQSLLFQILNLCRYAMAPACGLYLAKVHYDGSRPWAPRFPKDAQQQPPPPPSGVPADAGGAGGAGGGGGE